MLKLNADRIRIPKSAREAILRHEQVIVTSHDHPILAMVNVDDIGTNCVGYGKPFGMIVNELKNISIPDLQYFKDLQLINEQQEFLPSNPWE